jgi:O-methyltransferase involved in polyketide biosynthesis
MSFALTKTEGKRIMENMSEHPTDFNRIIPTAFLTAYPRTFTDIPYSTDIFTAVEDIKKTEGVHFDDGILSKNLAPVLEARYKMVDKILGELGTSQTLELAAGLSPRGLIMTQESSAIQYVELDLPDMAHLKRKVFDRCGIALPSNLHIQGGNILDESSIKSATDYFEPRQPVAIVSEGILGYLSFEEKSILTRHIVAVLERFGGCWISNDAPAANGPNRAQRAAKEASKSKLVSTKNFSKDLFDDLDHFKRFFGERGLTVQIRDLEEVLSELSSPAAIGLTEAEVIRRLSEYSSVAVMSLRDE